MKRRRYVLTGLGGVAGLMVMVCMVAAPGKALAVDEPAAAAPAGTATPAQASSPVEELTRPCFDCHGKGGVSVIPTRPTIAGQKPNYIVKQMKAFRRTALESLTPPAAGSTGKISDSRADTAMGHFSDAITESDLGPISLYLASLSCRAKVEPGRDDKSKPVATPPPLPAAARRCAACHGANGISQQAHVPNLAGQQRGYLRRELLLLRELSWNPDAPSATVWRTHPIMEKQVARLRIEDVDSIANYYTALDCLGEN